SFSWSSSCLTASYSTSRSSYCCLSFRAPRAKYTLVGEAIRHVIPAGLQCSIGCGGQSCKYDNPSYWKDDQQAIKGLYSSWYTCDYLLAMSRPSTETIEKYKIIDQFKRNGIKTVMNLQIPGEHASCGNPLEPESGFSYRPEIFMANDIYFYNFGWNDYGVLSTVTLVLDEQVALRRTLFHKCVLLACFLAYATRMTANQAILYVRQLHCVREFVQFLAPLRSVFSCAEPRSNSVTLSQYLNRQRHILHGYERKELRNLPKIVQLVSRLLLDIAENRQVIEEDILEAPDIHDLEMTLSIIEQMGPDVFAKEPRLPGTPTLPRHFNEPPIFTIAKVLATVNYYRYVCLPLGEIKMNGTKPNVRQEEHSEVPYITLQTELSLESKRLLVAQALTVSNMTVQMYAGRTKQGGGWERLCSERDPFILTGLMWSWLE
uniref:Protein tyrosine phosphatase domain containing 1b n=1 Tax=Labrus bergylta TaxID=56723 RepID=A0A3Q3ME24_9LABR